MSIAPALVSSALSGSAWSALACVIAASSTLATTIATTTTTRVERVPARD